MPDPKRSRLRQSVGMRFAIRAVRSTPHRLATVPTPNSVMRTFAGNDTARVIVSEFVRFGCGFAVYSNSSVTQSMIGWTPLSRREVRYSNAKPLPAGNVVVFTMAGPTSTMRAKPGF